MCYGVLALRRMHSLDNAWHTRTHALTHNFVFCCLCVPCSLFSPLFSLCVVYFVCVFTACPVRDSLPPRVGVRSVVGQPVHGAGGRSVSALCSAVLQVCVCVCAVLQVCVLCCRCVCVCCAVLQAGVCVSVLYTATHKAHSVPTHAIEHGTHTRSTRTHT